MAALATRVDPSDPVGVSVVIPTWQEAARIDALVAHLSWFPLVDIVVADGESPDGTAEVARRAGARVVRCPQRGRAAQMNRGAVAARGRVLWFVHADAWPPIDAVAQIRAALADSSVVGGAFLLRTVPHRGAWPWRPLLRVADLRSRLTRHPYGDQGIFVRRDAFDAVGGYPDVALMEDLALSQALRRKGRLQTVRSEITVSGRRFENRPLRSFAMMQAFPTLYRLGVPTERLAAWYGHER